MKWYYITFRSVTGAQIGERLLRRQGVECSLQRTPRWMEQKGCGYCLKLRPGKLSEALDILKNGGAVYSKVYMLDGTGPVREVEP